MKVARASAFVLCLAPSLVASIKLPPNPQSNQLRRRAAQGQVLAPLPTFDPETPPLSSPSARPYRGTEDAPVDGLDGKPHAGPFVDISADWDDTTAATSDATRSASLAKFATESDGKWRLEDIPDRNDGVMDDENRIAPKKGTTGTEGGISEKDRQRREGWSAMGNTPQEPKAAPPVLQDLIEEEFDARSSSTSYHGSHVVRDSDDAPTHGDPNGWLRETMPDTEGKTNPKPPSRSSSSSSSSITSFLSADRESWHEWFHSFVLSLTMILFSEIGDKTFLIAALMAMRHSQILVFSAAFSALVVMTVLSAVLGHAVPSLLPKRLTTLAAAILFLVFGAKMIREGLAMPRDSGVGEEMKEVEAELEEKEHTMTLERSRSNPNSTLSPFALEAGERGRQSATIKLPSPGGEPSPPASRSPSPSDRKRTSLAGLLNLCALVFSPAWVQTFVMTFLGEWGDRSQIATIAMAAGQDYWNVTLGALLGHACCTGLAVIGGRALAGKVSMRVVTIGGAVAFLAFGVIYLFECITER